MAVITPRACNPFVNPVNARPVIVEHDYPYNNHIFLARPLLGPLLFENTASDARDHLANERTFLSWVRLSIYLAIVSSAILISFHLSSQPTHTERVIALPLGIVFWLISLGCLANGFALYLNTIMKYTRRAALVQSGWKTQIMFVIMSLVIIGCCILFLITRAQSRSRKKGY